MPNAGSAQATDDSDDKNMKPLLTEDKLQRYIKAQSEGNDPFAIIGDLMGSGGSLDKAQATVKQQEEFAKQHGFSGSDEYMDVVGRVMLVEAILAATDTQKQTRDSMARSVADMEKQLADPATSAELKTELTTTLADQKSDLAQLEQDLKHPQVNEADLALVVKHKAELEAAHKANEAARKKH